MIPAGSAQTEIPALYAVSKGNETAWVVTLAVGWFWTFKQLSLTWSSQPNYQFGYLVPWIAILLAMRRIRATPGCLEASPDPKVGTVGRFFTGSGLAAAWGLFLFAELVRQFDPHWRMVGWMMMVSVTLLTGIWLWRRNGGKFPGALAFSLAFPWTAVPWPSNMEEMVTLKLRTLVTGATAAGLRATGIRAEQHGNIIDLANTSVIVDSACSGISSLQISIMASLCLGEFFLFGAGKRLMLLAAGPLLAVAGNLVRTALLARIADRGGAAAMLAWHDRLGYAESTGIFLALVLLAWGMFWNSAGRSLKSMKPIPPGTAALEIPQAGMCPGIGNGKEGFALCLAFASLPFLTWAWFALSPGGPVRTQEVPLWLLKSRPVGADWRVRPVTLPPMDIRTLDFTKGQTVCLTAPSQTSALVYHFFWKTDASTGYGHTPDICMVATGWELDGNPDTVKIRVGNRELPGTLYRFKRGGEEMAVFQCIWYGGDPLRSRDEFPYANGGPRTSRLAMLWNEPRRRGLESLNVYMPPAGDREAQARAAEEILAQLLVPNRAGKT